MRQLTQDQREALSNLTEDSEGCNAFLFALENAILAVEMEVLRSPIFAGKENDVLYKKLRAEGGRKLLEEARKLLLESPKSNKSRS